MTIKSHFAETNDGRTAKDKAGSQKVHVRTDSVHVSFDTQQ
jgi:hypothetical protein